MSISLEIAERFVVAALEIEAHSEGYIDAYYGPKELSERAKTNSRGLEELLKEMNQIENDISDLKVDDESSLEFLRLKFFRKQLQSCQFYLKNLIIKKTTNSLTSTFEEEAKYLYDANPPVHTAEDFQSILSQIDQLLPSNEHQTLLDRYSMFKKDFIIPKDKLKIIFDTAIQEARRRTKLKMQLPESEEFVVEFVNDKPWSGYNWYKGNFFSVIQINTDLPIYIDRAIDLAAHEGYPGHHVMNSLFEKNLVLEKKWVEFSVYPLFSPQSLIAEGSANYGIDVCFPDRTEYESSVLFELAGLDPSTAAKYYQIEHLVAKLSYSGNEAARGYLNGKMSQEQVVEWLCNYSLMAKERALQRTKFIETYRAYVINYNLGQDLVKNYVLKKVNEESNDEEKEKCKWKIFEWLLSTPQVASNLV